MSQLHAGPALHADFQTACNDSAGQAEEPKLIASAAISAPTHARTYSIHTRCIWHDWVQPSEDLADHSYTQSIQYQTHNAAVWAAEQESFSERSMGILRYMHARCSRCINLTGISLIGRPSDSCALTQLCVDAAGHERWCLVCYCNQMALVPQHVASEYNATLAAHTFCPMT